jgi:DNA-binding transcriptional LysR family regulator
MAHQQRSQARLSPSSDTKDTDDIVTLLAPRLAHFAGVARTEHVTRAAQEMQVPQSTLSRSMVRLEQDLGVDLFARRGRTVSLTPAGRTFLGSVERALAEIERAADETFVTLEPGYGLRRITDDLCTEAGFRPRIAFEGEEAETLRGLVAAGLGVALLPPPVFPRPGVVELTVTAPRAAREIGVAWLDGHPDTPPVAAFKKFLLSRRGSLLP